MDGEVMEELFAIIPKLPGVRIYQFAAAKEQSEALVRYCQENGCYLEIVALDDEVYENVKDLDAKVRRIDEAKERYNLRSMIFDTIFVNYDVTKIQNIEQFLRKIYRMMKNGADLVFFIHPDTIQKMGRLLEELNYVAINPIEIDGQNVLTAKKMHGWTKV